MTLLLAESFDFAGTAWHATKWNKLNTLTMGGNSPRSAPQSAWGATSAGCIRQVLPAEEDDTFILGVALYPTNVVSWTGLPLLALYSDSATTAHIVLATNSVDASKLDVWRGGTSGTLLGTTAAGALIANTHRYIEMKAVLGDGTSGTVVVKIDETVVLNLTGIDTKNGGTKTDFDSFGVIGATADFRYDDFYACNSLGSENNDFLGAIHVWAIVPKGNGATSQLTGDDGNSVDNYDRVNTGLPNAPSGQYVDGDTVGEKDTYTFYEMTNPSDWSPVIPGANSVKAIVVNAWAEKTDAGARGIDMVARKSGGTESTVTPEIALANGTYKLLWGVFEQMPGGGDWTVADVDAAEFGIITT